MGEIAKVGLPSLATVDPGNEHIQAGNIFAGERIEPGDACFISKVDSFAYRSLAAHAPTSLSSINVTAPGGGYTDPPAITIGAPNVAGGTQAAAVSVIDPLNGALSRIVLTNVGTGYTAAPAITVTPINSGPGGGATATAILNDEGNTEIEAARVRGFALMRAFPGDAVSLAENINLAYGSGLVAGSDVYLSGTVPGGLATTASPTAPAPIGYVLPDGKRIRVWASRYSGAEAILNNIGKVLDTLTAQTLALVKSAKIPFNTGAALVNTAAGVFTWQNPEANPVYITRAWVDTTHIATAACTLDIGVAATAILDDTLIDGLDVNAALIIADNIGAPGTNGKPLVKVPVGGFVTGSTASGAAAGLTGAAYINYTMSA